MSLMSAGQLSKFTKANPIVATVDLANKGTKITLHRVGGRFSVVQTYRGKSQQYEVTTKNKAIARVRSMVRSDVKWGEVLDQLSKII